DGDVYRLLEGPGGDVLVWVSRWDAESEAVEFARAAERALEVRYRGLSGRRMTVERVGSRMVRIVDAPAEGRSPPDALLDVEPVE
ncbi:MAG: hypothetical protein ACODAA_07390, partial [Gemmatimonadota bacterium]